MQSFNFFTSLFLWEVEWFSCISVKIMATLVSHKEDYEIVLCNQLLTIHCLSFHSWFRFFSFKQEVALKNKQEIHALPPPPQFYSSLIEEIGILGWDKYVCFKICFRNVMSLYSQFNIFAVLATLFIPVFSLFHCN